MSAAGYQLRELHRETPEVHVAAVCVREPQPGRFEVLVYRRSDARELAPGLLEGCGGQLAAGERFAEAAARHLRYEAGIDAEAPGVPIDEPVVLHVFYEIPLTGGGVIPGIRFLMLARHDAEPSSSFASWLPADELQRQPAARFVPGFQADVARLLQRWGRVRGTYR